MSYSRKPYLGDGSTKQFSVSFPYIIQEHVEVYVDGVRQIEDVDYVWFNETTIEFMTPPPNGSTVLLSRNSSRDHRLVDHQDASTLTEEVLDQDANQLFYVAQEAFDALEGTMALDTDDTWNATDKRIKDVAPPVDAQDVVTKEYGDANYGATAASSAAASASSAAASAAAAAGSATAAQEWAIKTSGPVSGNEWSAKKHAQDAAASAADAAASADAAALAVSSIGLPTPVAGSFIKRNSANTAYVAVTARQIAQEVANASALPATSGTVTLNFNSASNFSGTLTGDITLATPTNLQAGQSGVIVITNGATPREISYSTVWNFPGGTVPGLTQEAGAVDVLVYYVESAARISAVLHQGMANE